MTTPDHPISPEAAASHHLKRPALTALWFDGVNLAAAVAAVTAFFIGPRYDISGSVIWYLYYSDHVNCDGQGRLIFGDCGVDRFGEVLIEITDNLSLLVLMASGMVIFLSLATLFHRRIKTKPTGFMWGGAAYFGLLYVLLIVFIDGLPKGHLNPIGGGTSIGWQTLLSFLAIFFIPAVFLWSSTRRVDKLPDRVKKFLYLAGFVGGITPVLLAGVSGNDSIRLVDLWGIRGISLSFGVIYINAIFRILSGDNLILRQQRRNR